VARPRSPASKAPAVDPRPRPRPRRRLDDSLLRGGLTGIAAVTLATLGLALAGAAIAFVVSLFY
jgi:predicted lipid-binding transport protein (Tim44 family)